MTTLGNSISVFQFQFPNFGLPSKPTNTIASLNEGQSDGEFVELGCNLNATHSRPYQIIQWVAGSNIPLIRIAPVHWVKRCITFMLQLPCALQLPAPEWRRGWVGYVPKWRKSLVGDRIGINSRRLLLHRLVWLDLLCLFWFLLFSNNNNLSLNDDFFFIDVVDTHS